VSPQMQSPSKGRAISRETLRNERPSRRIRLPRSVIILATIGAEVIATSKAITDGPRADILLSSLRCVSLRHVDAVSPDCKAILSRRLVTGWAGRRRRRLNQVLEGFSIPK
jgi:hypothetical protein